MITAKFNNGINDLTTENLYQWDTYQTLVISGVNFSGLAPKVHFCNKKSTEALVVQSNISTATEATVAIPNTLLTEKYDILAYIYINDGLASKTIKSITIPVIPRLKPSEYVEVTNEDIVEIEALELQAKLILNGLKSQIYSSTTRYKRPNIVYYQNASYMCNVDEEIQGILPTDTSKWQLMCYGSAVTNVNKDSDGNLKFTFDNGETYTVPIAVVDASTASVLLGDMPINADGSVDITKPGLYACVVQLDFDPGDGLIYSEYYSTVMTIDGNNVQYGIFYSSSTVITSSGVGSIKVYYLQYNPTTNKLKCTTQGKIIKCKLIVEY